MKMGVSDRFKYEALRNAIVQEDERIHMNCNNFRRVQAFSVGHGGHSSIRCLSTSSVEFSHRRKTKTT